MAIHSVYVSTTPEQTQRGLSHIDAAASGLRFEFIPAGGGCVVALVPIEMPIRKPSPFASFNTRVSELRRLARTQELMALIAALEPAAPATAATSVPV